LTTMKPCRTPVTGRPVSLRTDTCRHRASYDLGEGHLACIERFTAGHTVENLARGVFDDEIEVDAPRPLPRVSLIDHAIVEPQANVIGILLTKLGSLELPKNSSAGGITPASPANGTAMTSAVNDVTFGVFDHMDRTVARALHYEERLKLIEAYDRAASMPITARSIIWSNRNVPSPSVFLAAVAQRTTRLRFGPLVYVLPSYHRYVSSRRYVSWTR